MNKASSKDRVEIEKNNIIVQTVENSKTKIYEYDSISNKNTIIFK